MSRSAIIFAGILLLLAEMPAPAANVSGTGTTAQDATALVNQIIGPGITLVGQPVLTGVANQQGTLTNGTTSVGIDRGIVLSSGNVTRFNGANTTQNETRGNNSVGDEVSTLLGTQGDTELTAIAGGPTHDANVLTFSFRVGDGTKPANIKFRFVFASEEYINYIDSQYNDVFGFFLDGQNIALVGGAPLTINTVNDQKNSGAYVNNVTNTNGLAVAGRLIQFDGLTQVLTASATNLAPGTHTISLKVADVGDDSLDSAVFIESGSFVRAEPLSAAPPSLSFTHQVGSTPPAPQDVTISTTGITMRISPTIVGATPGAPDPTWASVAVVPPGTVWTPSQLRVSVNPAGLPPGTYSAALQARCVILLDAIACPPDTQVTIPITMSVNANVQQSLTFSTSAGNLPPSQTVTLPFPATAVPAAPWLGAAFVPPGTNVGTQLIVSVVQPMQPGVYTSGISIAFASNPTAPVTIPVTLNVSSPPLVFMPPVQIPSPAAVCPSTTLTVGQAFGGTLTAMGGAGEIYWSLERGDLPPGLRLIGNTVTGTPNAAGTYTYTLEASSNGASSARRSCSVTVLPSPLKVTTGCPTTSVPQGSYFAFPVIPSGGMGGTSYQYSATGLPAGLSVTNGRIVGNPSADPGNYTAEIQVTSGNQTATLRCTFSVSEPLPDPDRPNPLRLSGDCPTQTFLPRDTVTLQVSASGGRGGYQFSIESGPSWLSLSSAGARATLTGVAPTPGQYPVTVAVSDGNSSTTFGCTILVNSPPLTLSGTCPANELSFGDTLSLPLSASGGRGALTWRMDGPSWLSLSASTGSTVTVSGTPPDVGEVPFTVAVTDTDAVSRQFTCAAKITARPLRLTAAQSCPATLEWPAGLAVDFTAAGGVSPLRWELQGPAWLSLSSNSGNTVRLTGVPVAEGPVTLTVTVRDERGTAPASFSCAFSVPRLALPTAELAGLTAAVDATESGDLSLRLSSPAPRDLRAIVALSFEPAVDLPNFSGGSQWIQFRPAPGGAEGTVVDRYTIEVPVRRGDQTISLGARVMLSNIAGIVRVQLKELRDGNFNLLGTASIPQAELSLAKRAPVIFPNSVQFTRSELTFGGYSNTLDIQSVTLTFNPRADMEIDGEKSFRSATQLQADIQQFYRRRLGEAAGGQIDPNVGSQFQLRFPIAIEGDNDVIESVSITIVNSAGSTQSGPHPLR